MQKKVVYYEKWVGRHASFPPRRSVNYFKEIYLAKNLVQKTLRLSEDLLWVFNKISDPNSMIK